MGDNTGVCIVVLGDIGRSPRMQYHAVSIAEHGYKVDMVGYGETQPIENLKALPNVNFHYLPQYPAIAMLGPVNYFLKAMWQFLTLFFVLLIIRRPRTLLIQNPPAVPSLLVCYLFTRIVRAKLIVDWHNYTHSILALSLLPGHILVSIAEKLEFWVGKRAEGNFCVTNAMREDLRERFDISANTLYDRPFEIFDSPVMLEQQHEIISRLGLKYKGFLGNSKNADTVFTHVEEDGSITTKNPPAALLISSTSWTEDEDFSILLSALQEYENHCVSGNQRDLPKLICVITGKGPQKDYYCEKIAKKDWQYVSVITPWLESKDYPVLLACADLGVCLHTSSSGLDLPMKVVDMFGCGITVCAYNFKCLDELVRHMDNGFVFNNTKELGQLLQSWFEGFPRNTTRVVTELRFRAKTEKFRELPWRENWDQVALPMFQ